MKKVKFGHIAVGITGFLAMQNALAMDVETVKDAKTGKVYFCANAQCAGNSTCMGAGNDKCGSINKCAKELGHPVGWTDAKDKESCEKNGAGKWLAYKPEYSIKAGNKAPLGAEKKAKK